MSTDYGRLQAFEKLEAIAKGLNPKNLATLVRTGAKAEGSAWSHSGDQAKNIWARDRAAAAKVGQNARGGTMYRGNRDQGRQARGLSRLTEPTIGNKPFEARPGSRLP